MIIAGILAILLTGSIVSSTDYNPQQHLSGSALKADEVWQQWLGEIIIQEPDYLIYHLHDKVQGQRKDMGAAFMLPGVRDEWMYQANAAAMFSAAVSLTERLAPKLATLLLTPWLSKSPADADIKGCMRDAIIASQLLLLHASVTLTKEADQKTAYDIVAMLLLPIMGHQEPFSNALRSVMDHKALEGGLKALKVPNGLLQSWLQQYNSAVEGKFLERAKSIRLDLQTDKLPELYENAAWERAWAKHLGFLRWAHSPAPTWSNETLVRCYHAVDYVYSWTFFKASYNVELTSKEVHSRIRDVLHPFVSDDELLKTWLEDPQSITRSKPTMAIAEPMKTRPFFDACSLGSLQQFLDVDLNWTFEDCSKENVCLELRQKLALMLASVAGQLLKHFGLQLDNTSSHLVRLLKEITGEPMHKPKEHYLKLTFGLARLLLLESIRENSDVLPNLVAELLLPTMAHESAGNLEPNLWGVLKATPRTEFKTFVKRVEELCGVDGRPIVQLDGALTEWQFWYQVAVGHVIDRAWELHGIWQLDEKSSASIPIGMRSTESYRHALERVNLWTSASADFASGAGSQTNPTASPQLRSQIQRPLAQTPATAAQSTVQPQRPLPFSTSSGPTATPQRKSGLSPQF